MSKLVGQTGKLDGSLGDGFRDLLGEETLSNFSKLTNNVKALTEAFAVGFGPVVVSGGLAGFVGMLASCRDFKSNGATVPIISTALTAMAAKSVIGIGVNLGLFTSKFLGTIAALGPLAIPIAASALAGATALVGKAMRVDDFTSGPGGITTMMGPAGIFSLNPRDSVLATTNPIPVNDMRTGPAGSMNAGVNVSVEGKISGRDIVFFQESGAEFGDAPGNGLM